VSVVPVQRAELAAVELSRLSSMLIRNAAVSAALLAVSLERRRSVSTNADNAATVQGCCHERGTDGLGQQDRRKTIDLVVINTGLS
jgi:hypothetical protein